MLTFRQKTDNSKMLYTGRNQFYPQTSQFTTKLIHFFYALESSA